MTEEMSQEWYSNKELFERLGGLKDDVAELRSEMKETRALIKNYNGLREEIEALKEKVHNMETSNSAKKSVMHSFRDWGGWFIAVITLFYVMYDHFK